MIIKGYNQQDADVLTAGSCLMQTDLRLTLASSRMRCELGLKSQRE